MSELLTESTPQTGRVEWIGVAAERRGTIVSLDEATLQPGTGIDGEHHAVRGKSQRQVTLIQHEHLPVIAALAGREGVEPELLRRNLVVSGITLAGLKNRRFRIGAVLLEGTGDCDPCSRMEENLGRGGCQAMQGHGGITAIVHAGGTIRVGDAVTAVNSEAGSGGSDFS